MASFFVRRTVHLRAKHPHRRRDIPFNKRLIRLLIFRIADVGGEGAGGFAEYLFVEFVLFGRDGEEEAFAPLVGGLLRGLFPMRFRDELGDGAVDRAVFGRKIVIVFGIRKIEFQGALEEPCGEQGSSFFMRRPVQ